jgi:hypothetical protein
MLHVASIIAVVNDLLGSVGNVLARRCNLVVQVVADPDPGIMATADTLTSTATGRTGLALT